MAKKEKKDSFIDKLSDLQKNFQQRAKTYESIARNAAVEVAYSVKSNFSEPEKIAESKKIKDGIIDFSDYMARVAAYEECSKWLGKVIMEHQLEEKK